MKIQRIMCVDNDKDCNGHTHAILGPLFVPYSKYSIRYVVYHLYRLFVLFPGMSIEDYCLNNKISVKKMNEWIQWIEDAIPLLVALRFLPPECNLGTNDVKGKRAKLKATMLWFFKKPVSFYSCVLSVLKKVLFQKHRMPPFTRYFSTYRIKPVA